MKTCRNCKVPKERAEFYKHPSCKDRRDTLCKDCKKVDVKAYQEQNRARVSACHKAYYRKHREEILAHQEENRGELRAKKKAHYTKNREDIIVRKKESRYGLIPGDFKRMFSEQCGVCAICSGPGGKKGLGVDHDHENGKVRALLCGPCNIGLGYFKDSPAVVQMALDYLKRHGKKG